MLSIILIFILSCMLNKTSGDNYAYMKEYIPIKHPQKNLYLTGYTKIDTLYKESVDLELYYECHCPYCINFERNDLKNVLIDLNQYLNVKTYPYGNAKTTVKGNGKIQFKCQHGPKECYGNKLHACALKHISNQTEALLFNICMMESNTRTRGSDDEAAARCSREMNIYKRPILRCANGDEGDQLLKYYGEESKKANVHYVPYILLNGVEWDGADLKQDVCAKFLNPPEPCQR